MGYFVSSIRGISYTALLKIVSRGITFLKIFILARIFSPSEFGLFAIVSIILAFFEVITETGINVYIIQEKKHIKEYISEAWIISIARGFLIGLLIMLSASLVSAFFSSRNSFPLLILAGFIPMIRGFINPAETLFQKELKFKNEFNFRISIFAFESFATVALALLFHSISSLVLGLVASAFFEVILSFVVFPFRPRLRFDKQIATNIIKKGKWVTLSNIFSYLAAETDTVTVGKILGTSLLGSYQMAYTLSTLPITEITDVVSKVTFPVFAKISDDKRRLASGYFRSSAVIALAAVSVGLVLILFPKQVILVILGGKWLAAASVLPILALYGIFRAIFGYVPTLLLAVHKQKYVAVLIFVRLFALVSTIVPLTILYGAIGASISVLLSSVVEIPFDVYYLFKVLRKSHYPPSRSPSGHLEGD